MGPNTKEGSKKNKWGKGGKKNENYDTSVGGRKNYSAYCTVVAKGEGEVERGREEAGKEEKQKKRREGKEKKMGASKLKWGPEVGQTRKGQ